MELGTLIETLEALPQQGLILPNGFYQPHSYRGVYAELAFEPTTDITIAHMLEEAKEALDGTYEGYKGGSFKMTAYTDCHLATHGECGEALTAAQIELWVLAAQPKPEPSTLRLHWHADLQALDAALDRIAPKVTALQKSLDRRCGDDEPRPSLAFRLGWLEGHLKAQDLQLQRLPMYREVAWAAREYLDSHTTAAAKRVLAALEAVEGHMEAPAWPAPAAGEEGGGADV